VAGPAQQAFEQLAVQAVHLAAHGFQVDFHGRPFYRKVDRYPKPMSNRWGTLALSRIKSYPVVDGLNGSQIQER
jgi:hypothetical protein